MNAELYNKEYYKAITPGSSSSASIILPIVFSMHPTKSVIDVGCGTGSWLEVCCKLGVQDVIGIDGFHIDKNTIRIPREKFIEADLEKPLFMNRKFDLVISLEVAEHIRPENAGLFVNSLCNLGNVILFSAAVPGQGGVNHLNEQYPEYWERLFIKNGFILYDSLREKIWTNRDVDTCYRQNIFFALNNSVSQDFISITKDARQLLPLIHPEHYEHKEIILQSYKKILRTPFHSAWYFIKAFLRLFTKRH